MNNEKKVYMVPKQNGVGWEERVVSDEKEVNQVYYVTQGNSAEDIKQALQERDFAQAAGLQFLLFPIFIGVLTQSWIWFVGVLVAVLFIVFIIKWTVMHLLLYSTLFLSWGVAGWMIGMYGMENLLGAILLSILGIIIGYVLNGSLLKDIIEDL